MTMTGVSRPRDVARQIVVVLALCAMLLCAWIGVGGLGGTPIQDAQGGALAADATYLAPAGPAFSIWTVIYVGLAGYAVWQVLPSQRASRRQRALGWWITLTMLLNGLWLLAVQFLQIWWTVVVIVVLLAALCVAFQRAVATRLPGDGVWDSVLIDGVTGLHLGWVAVATVANVAAWLTEIGPDRWGAYSTVAGLGALAVVLIVGLVLAWRSGWRVTPGLALMWGLVWIGIGRLVLQPRDTAIGWTAIAVGVVVAAVPLVVTGLRPREPEHD